MKITYIEEPLLQFGYGQSQCPKDGIGRFHPYDLELVRPEKIKTAFIGRADSVDSVVKWIEECKFSIPEKISKNPKPNLFPRFPGFNQNLAFKSEISYDDSYIRKINNSDIEEALKEKGSLDDRIEKMVELYLGEIKFLAKNKYPDLILCVLSEKFMEEITLAELSKEGDSDEDAIEEGGDEEEDYLETNFRRLLKARAMQYNIPIQIVRDRIVSAKPGMQDQATICWNFFTALYYKAGGTPWALIKPQDFDTCYAGISFYRSRDRQTIQTSVAQIFNERGKGVILRGEPVEMKKFDRTPHLSDEQAFRLLDNSLQEYWEAIKIFPKRLVLHKTSNYSEAEIKGFQEAAKKRNIHAVDMVTIHERTDLRLYREQDYPPRRGVLMSMDEKNYLLYSRGAVEFYETYTGKYIPHPLQVRLFKYDENPELINQEILALTKMNWNNTQFDRRFPITIECSRNVGEILKYLRPEDDVQIKYGFYM
jgi:hypothetical protein